MSAAGQQGIETAAVCRHLCYQTEGVTVGAEHQDEEKTHGGQVGRHHGRSRMVCDYGRVLV